MTTEADRIERSNDQLAAIVRSFHHQIVTAQIDHTTRLELERQIRLLQTRNSEYESRLVENEAMLDNIRKRVVSLEGTVATEVDLNACRLRMAALEKKSVAVHKRLHALDQEGDPLGG